jgi:hypothetical protein
METPRVIVSRHQEFFVISFQNIDVYFEDNGDAGLLPDGSWCFVIIDPSVARLVKPRNANTFNASILAADFARLMGTEV